MLPPGPVGYLDERSAWHARGWAQDRGRPGHRLAVSAWLDGAELLAGVADRARPELVALGIGDGRHGYDLRFPRPLGEDEQERLEMRAEGVPLPVSPYLSRRLELVSYVAMDVVNNCNLRCPFCVYDYADVKRTEAMDEAVFDAALRLLPHTGAGHFWLSCLHEPTLHPRFAELLRRLPPDHAGNAFFTTNLARRMPPAYYETLAASGLHHVNVSLESLDPALYERMRQGARFRIFAEQWEMLLGALGGGPRPPALRYNLMGYRSNLRELPSLARRLLERGRAAQVEIRATMDERHIPRAFAAAEYLGEEEWRWLRRELRGLPRGAVVLVLPPGLAAAEPDDGEGPVILANTIMPTQAGPGPLRPRPPYDMQVNHAGAVAIYGHDTDPRTGRRHKVLARQGWLQLIADLPAFFAEIEREAEAEPPPG